MSDDLEARVDRMQTTQVFMLTALLVLGVIVALLFIMVAGNQGVPLRVAGTVS